MGERSPADQLLPGILRFLDHTNLTVTTLTACFVLYTRSAGVAYFTGGAVLCSFTVKLLKKVIRQPRPVVTSHTGRRTLTYGMPSTHSATITFFATYILLACTYLSVHPSLPQSNWISRLFPPLITIPWATAIVMSRVWLGHHTWRQVVVGMSYGATFAAGWFALWTRSLYVYGQRVEEVIGNPLAAIPYIVA
ncbi:phosphatidic acid phosphatase type 2/haloperoxidase [Crucibulum laeve]|uniref:Phosphatidic acid phosphatase type 2/haloperoxidase n=1 Tax=Crucibulum laeve TaxID=68775 RepID=A0A5C3MFF7_9AGAR|nr:phosphatidic acid phosphatase type 2/haloperoxidase [Crucibulum laeve]